MTLLYLKVRWRHQLPEEAVLWYHELDDKRREIRKVVIFRDGRAERAGSGEGTDYTFLSSESLPGIEDINLQGEFHAEGIHQPDFEMAWRQASPKSS